MLISYNKQWIQYLFAMLLGWNSFLNAYASTIWEQEATQQKSFDIYHAYLATPHKLRLSLGSNAKHDEVKILAPSRSAFPLSAQLHYGVSQNLEIGTNLLDWLPAQGKDSYLLENVTTNPKIGTTYLPNFNLKHHMFQMGNWQMAFVSHTMLALTQHAGKSLHSFSGITSSYKINSQVIWNFGILDNYTYGKNKETMLNAHIISPFAGINFQPNPDLTFSFSFSRPVFGWAEYTSNFADLEINFQNSNREVGVLDDTTWFLTAQKSWQTVQIEFGFSNLEKKLDPSINSDNSISFYLNSTMEI